MKNQVAQRDIVVEIYPLGIQIETITQDRSTIPPSQRRTVGKAIFLPREVVVDCVVNEVVLGHKVLSQLLFRVRCSSLKEGLADTVRLVQAFPGVEMTYVECLAMRAEINKFLLQEKVPIDR